MLTMADSSETYDLIVIGGGINGAGVACDAAGRGLSVLLCESGDLAGATSSASSKLIHGGLRYLEHNEFRLVREALKEREVMLAKASHLVQPLRFILPEVSGMRPTWMLRAGLFLYDHLYRRKIMPGSGRINLTTEPAGTPLKNSLKRGFYYWDCFADDARLVVLNARAAADLGAAIAVQTEVVDGKADGQLWHLRLKDCTTGQIRSVHGRAIVNAAGPWASDIVQRLGGKSLATNTDQASVRLVKGSHIVVPRIAGADDAYILQHEDQRVVFVIPFEDDYSLIGTTDTPYDGDPADVVIDAQERSYLLEVVARCFANPPTPDDIVWSYSGVRPLYDEEEDDPSKVSRDYKLQPSNQPDQPPLISVLGGKITTYRKLAEQVMDDLFSAFPAMGPSWTAAAKLPGGDVPLGQPESHLAVLCATYPDLDQTYLVRLNRRYGSLTDVVLGDAKSMADLGQRICDDLYEREVLYMKTKEWAHKPDDVLWRRSKAGLRMTIEERKRAAETLADIL